MQPRLRAAAVLLTLLLLAPAGLGQHAAQPLTPAALHSLALRGDVHGLRDLLAPPPGRAADAMSYGWQVQGVAAAALPDVGVADRDPLARAVADAYATYHLPAPGAAQLADMAAQERALGPRLDRAAAQLLEALVAHAPIAQRAVADAFAQGSDVPAADASLVRGSALRIGRAADAVSDALRALPPMPARGTFLFQDPLGLVLVGDAGSNTYAGNHAGTPFILPTVNLLTLDLGGDDVYTDNAGGAYPLQACIEYAVSYDPLGYQHTHYVLIPPNVDDPRLGLCGNGVAAAASIDLAGNDRYVADEDLQRDMHLAAQGGGIGSGVGVLVDLGGDDAYASVANDIGVAAQDVQGAGGMHGFMAYGFLLDLGQGRDTYLAEEHTVYDAQQFSQQRAQGAGEGLLLDDGGDDTYAALQLGPANSWQMAQANIAELLDLAGNDRYTAVQQGFTGSVQGVQGDDGLLLDLEGDDVYQASQECSPDPCFWQNVQGSAEAGGTGELVDAAGDDLYYASSNGEQHNQASGVLAPTVLIDLAGQDRYLDVQAGAAQYAQAAGKGALSVLLDAQGDDRYTVLHLGPGEQWAQGASGSTTNPFPPPTPPPLVTSVASALLDLGGDDVYTATMDTPGQVQVVQGAGAGAGGVLVDCAGTNSYSDPQAGQGVWTQGATGVGVDCARLLASLP